MKLKSHNSFIIHLLNEGSILNIVRCPFTCFYLRLLNNSSSMFTKHSVMLMIISVVLTNAPEYVIQS